MTLLNKISPVLLFCHLVLASVFVYGQNTTIQETKSKWLTLGFQTGRNVLFQTSASGSSKSKVRHAVSKNLVARKMISSHIGVETGIKYSSVPGNTSLRDNNTFVSTATNSISLPMSIQYCFLPERSRVHPYIGTGMQCDLNKNPNGFPPFTSDINVKNKVLTGTRYISLLITQGITFQINTKIQVSQSFHFIPGTVNKTFGLDFGIGYTF